MTSCNKPIDKIPEIDIIAANHETREVKLSQLASEIVYLKLETTPASRFISKGFPKVIVGKNIILVGGRFRENYIMVFDHYGQFLNRIANSGNQLEDFNMISNWDLSPDGKMVLVQDRFGGESMLKLYNVDGTFIRANKIQGTTYSSMHFLTSEKIIGIRDLRRMTKDAMQITINTLEMEPIDSLFFLDSLAITQGKSTNHRSFINYHNNSILLRKPNRDTVFSLGGTLRPETEFIIRTAEKKQISIEDINVIRDNILINIVSKRKYDGENIDYSSDDIIVYNSITGNTYSAKKYLGTVKSLDTIKHPAIFNDMDPLGNIYPNNFKDNKYITSHSIVSIKKALKNIMMSDTNDLMNSNIEKLEALIEQSKLGDNPIIRIVNFNNKPLRFSKKRSKESKELAQKEFKLETIDLVNLNDGWKMKGSVSSGGPAGSAGITFNPKDNTIWFMDFFEKTLYHYSVKGEDLKDGFSLDSIAGEGIAFDPTDDSFWILGANEYISHISINGKNLEDGFDLSKYFKRYTLGISHDLSDSTIWIIGNDENSVFHFDKKGNYIDDGFSFEKESLQRPGGMFCDPRDNSLWIVDHPAHVYHYNQSGELLNDSYRLGELAPTIINPEGICFDPNTETFWVIGLGDEIIYHIGYK